MQRDKILRKDLEVLKLKLRVSNFYKGKDVVQVYGTGGVEVAMLGDMPSVAAVLKEPSYVIGLAKRSFSSVVSIKYSRLELLKGRKVAYSKGSSSHLVLLLGLKTVGLTEKDVELVEMAPVDMPDALDSGKVDAFSAWEPTPLLSISRNTGAKMVYRGLSTDWVVASQAFAKANTGAVLHIAASLSRAVNWLRTSPDNLRKATSWVLQDGQAFQGRPLGLTIEQASKVARDDMLNVLSIPLPPQSIEDRIPLIREYEFLRLQGSVSTNGVDESKSINNAFDFKGLQKILGNPRTFRTYDYDYDN